MACVIDDSGTTAAVPAEMRLVGLAAPSTALAAVHATPGRNQSNLEMHQGSPIPLPSAHTIAQYWPHDSQRLCHSKLCYHRVNHRVGRQAVDLCVCRYDWTHLARVAPKGVSCGSSTFTPTNSSGLKAPAILTANSALKAKLWDTK